MTKTEKFSIDTNVLVYLMSGEATKGSLAESILLKRPVISVQVFNEFTSVARRKYMKDFASIKTVLAFARKAALEIVPVTLAVHELALEISRDNGLQIYDANIIAAAELAGCDTLFTEDLNHGQRIGRVTIHNPFMVA